MYGLMATAAIAIAIAYATFEIATRAPRILERTRRRIDSPRPLRLDAAAISQDLVPLINKIIAKSSSPISIDILGYDCDYFRSGNGSYFSKALKRWANSGATINYHAISPSSEACPKLHELLANTGENFVVYQYEPSLANEVEMERISKFTTLHPTIVRTSGGDAMWVEYNHPVGEKFAYNVKFTSSEALRDPKERKEFSEYVDFFDFLKARSTRHAESFEVREAA